MLQTKIIGSEDLPIRVMKVYQRIHSLHSIYTFENESTLKWNSAEALFSNVKSFSEEIEPKTVNVYYLLPENWCWIFQI